MERQWWAKFILLLTCIVLSVIYVYPSLTNMDFEENSSYPIQEKITLGLDLQGGVYMVLGVDFNKVFKEVVERQAISVEERLKEKNIAGKNFAIVTNEQNPEIAIDDPHFKFDFDPDKKDQIYELIKEEYDILAFKDLGETSYELGLSVQFRSTVRERTIDQSKEVIRNRIDEFGVAEPSIASQGIDRIIVELPGVEEIERAKALIGRTAKLEFKMVDDEGMGKLNLPALVAELEKENNFTFKEGDKFSEYVEKVNRYAKDKLPPNTMISFERRVAGPGGTESTAPRAPYLVGSQANLTGEELLDAQVQIDPEQRTPVVSFRLNPRGANTFEKLTRESVGKRLAIVLDNTVYSAPVIQGPIPGGSGQITLGSGNMNDMMKEAKDLAIVLRAGALPAQLEFLEQRVVGPSLGQDSIRKGGYAGVFGAICVLVFIAIYYRVSGLIASMSLVFNVLFVLAILIGLKATLTLPGIAGIALTVGIAVDSNVVIYERIREELRAGKKVMAAVEAGFQKAIRTILDANVTNAAAAIVLLNFGTGPVKGFAVTMLIGIITTLFTAVFVCRLFFDLYLSRLESNPKATVSI